MIICACFYLFIFIFGVMFGWVGYLGKLVILQPQIFVFYYDDDDESIFVVFIQ